MVVNTRRRPRRQFKIPGTLVTLKPNARRRSVYDTLSQTWYGTYIIDFERSVGIVSFCSVGIVISVKERYVGNRKRKYLLIATSNTENQPIIGWVLNDDWTSVL